MKPARDVADTIELHLQYLDRYREIVEKKLTGLSDAELRGSRLPSGWSPLELLKHLVFMERRWLRWGFTGEQVEHPWGEPAEIAEAGGRFGPDDRPTLNWILFHVLQEYARHAGHLDVARELVDGATGE